MKTIIYTLSIIALLNIVSCKKKTTIKARVFNYAMNEPIAEAKVDLVEKKEVGTLGGSSSSCEVIASATTDVNGYCIFDGEKLKTASKFEYFLGVSSAYGISQSYPCGGKTSGFLSIGEDNEQTLNMSYFDGYLKVQFKDLLSPSQTGDTLSLRITSAYYQVPGNAYPAGGGGVLVSFPFHGSSNYPYPSLYEYAPEKTQCGFKIVNVRKRKLGIVTISIDTILVRPNVETLLEIQW